MLSQLKFTSIFTDDVYILYIVYCLLYSAKVIFEQYKDFWVEGACWRKQLSVVTTARQLFNIRLSRSLFTRSRPYLNQKQKKMLLLLLLLLQCPPPAFQYQAFTITIYSVPPISQSKLNIRVIVIVIVIVTTARQHFNIRLS